MKIIHFEEISSTNKYIKENYDSLENFTFVVADYQSDGKGRENRSWISPSNENLLFSFLIKDKKLFQDYKALSIGTATLVGRFLEFIGIENVMIKWPNDVYVNDKKICGILLEGNIEKYIALGVGLNVNQATFKGEYRVTPTSIRKELGKDIDVESLKVLLFEFIMKHMNQKGFKSHTLKFYQKHDYLLGKTVSISNITGKVQGITENFDLLIDDKIISSGEIN